MARVQPAGCLRLAASLLLAWGMTGAALWSDPAHAQYQWRDENGGMVYSDRPPPPHINPADILKTPNRRGINNAVPAKPAAGGTEASARPGASGGPDAPAPATPAADAPTRSYADQEMEFRKRRAEREQAEKKDNEARVQAAARKEACERAQSYLRTLESGTRIISTNAAGERIVVDDAQRERETAAARRQVADTCQ